MAGKAITGFEPRLGLDFACLIFGSGLKLESNRFCLVLIGLTRSA
jgi:hypothetical protein